MARSLCALHENFCALFVWNGMLKIQKPKNLGSSIMYGCVAKLAYTIMGMHLVAAQAAAMVAQTQGRAGRLNGEEIEGMPATELSIIKW